MVKTKFATLTRIAPALALLGCAAPKAIVIEPPPKPTQELAAVAPDLTTPDLPADGIRLPDMLAMPGDGDFRATSPNVPKPGGEAGAVIARPPTDPPSRPKPKAPATE